MSERHLPLPQLAFPFGGAVTTTVVEIVPSAVDAHAPSPLDRDASALYKPNRETVARDFVVPEFEREDDARTGVVVTRSRSKTKRLEESLRQRLGDETRLQVTDNRALLLSTSRKNGTLTARVHQMFLGGDDELFEAIAIFLDRGDSTSGKIIDAFVELSGHLLDLHAAPLAKNAGKGRVFDLDEVFLDVNSAYFDGSMDAEIMWGQTGAFRGRRRRSITLGSYDSRAHRITMHPAMDQERVPKICIARVVHHEMLHIKHPTVTGPTGRRIVHGKIFRAEEAKFLGAAEADTWIDANLESILRYRPRKR